MGGDGGGCGLERRKRAASSTTSNPRSAVSAAVSDESVAGDSGVFEAAHHHHHRKGEDLVGALAMSLETAQVQVKLRYSRQDTRALVKNPGFFSSEFRLQTSFLDPYSILLDPDPGLNTADYGFNPGPDLDQDLL
jgi:hypothetical protein